MDDRLVEQAQHHQSEVFDGLAKAREGLVKLNRLRVAGGEPAIPKAMMKVFARSLETAGQIVKDYRV